MSQQRSHFRILITAFQEIITGKVPFPDKSDRAVIGDVVFREGTPDRPLDCIPTESKGGDALWQLLTACWVRDASARPQAVVVEEKVRAQLVKRRISPYNILSRDIDARYHCAPVGIWNRDLCPKPVYQSGRTPVRIWDCNFCSKLVRWIRVYSDQCWSRRSSKHTKIPCPVTHENLVGQCIVYPLL
jgi:hypothetical protein